MLMTIDFAHMEEDVPRSTGNVPASRSAVRQAAEVGVTAAFQEASRHGFEHAKFPRGFHDNHVADLSETAWDGDQEVPGRRESLPSPSQATRLSGSSRFVVILLP